MSFDRHPPSHMWLNEKWVPTWSLPKCALSGIWSWDGDHQGERADLLTRWDGDLGATGWPSPPCVWMEKLKSQSDFIFYVDSLSLFLIFMEMSYEERMPAGRIFIFLFSIHSSPFFTLLCSQEADLHALIQCGSPILWLPGRVGHDEVSLGDQNVRTEVGVFTSFLPHSEAADVQWLPFCSKVTDLRGWFSPLAVAIDLAMFQ